jgi:hypothetical protein
VARVKEFHEKNLLLADEDFAFARGGCALSRTSTSCQRVLQQWRDYRHQHSAPCQALRGSREKANQWLGWLWARRLLSR